MAHWQRVHMFACAQHPHASTAATHRREKIDDMTCNSISLHIIMNLISQYDMIYAVSMAKHEYVIEEANGMSCTNKQFKCEIKPLKRAENE